MIQKFIKTVEAVQWTNESGNYPEILKFGQTKIRMASPLVWKEQNVTDCLEVQTSNGVLLCPRNHWIIKDGDNYSVLDDVLKIGRECW